jgi:hypothetical protein
MAVEKHEFIGFLEGRDALGSCVACKRADWRLLTREVLDLKRQILKEFSLVAFEVPTGASSVGVYVLVCGGCGLVRMHAVDGFTGVLQEKE